MKSVVHKVSAIAQVAEAELHKSTHLFDQHTHAVTLVERCCGFICALDLGLSLVVGSLPCEVWQSCGVLRHAIDYNRKILGAVFGLDVVVIILLPLSPCLLKVLSVHLLHVPWSK